MLTSDFLTYCIVKFIPDRLVNFLFYSCLVLNFSISTPSNRNCTYSKCRCHFYRTICMSNFWSTNHTLQLLFVQKIMFQIFFRFGFPIFVYHHIWKQNWEFLLSRKSLMNRKLVVSHLHCRLHTMFLITSWRELHGGYQLILSIAIMAIKRILSIHINGGNPHPFLIY